jgi:hypothetical protein
MCILFVEYLDIIKMSNNLVLFPFQAFSQDFPTKAITVYCGQSAGKANLLARM